MPSLLYDASIIDAHSLNPTTDFAILILGKTGSGKTSVNQKSSRARTASEFKKFVRNVTGIDIGVNETMQGKLTETKMVALRFLSPDSVGRYRIVFVDTPGFDQDSPVEDRKIEQRITKRLEDLKKVGVAISAIVYLIAIDDAAIINHHKQYKVENPCLSPTTPKEQLHSPSMSVPSLAETVISNSLTDRLFQRVLKCKAYYSADSDQHSLFFFTTNWSVTSRGSDRPPATAIEWELYAREDLTSKWNDIISANAKPCFHLGRLANTQENAFKNLAEILNLSRTSLTFALIEEIRKATSHANQVLSRFNTLDSTLSLLQQQSQSAIKPSSVVQDPDAKLSNKDVIIAVMGPTGAGKSSFIKAVTGVDPGINHDMGSSGAGVRIITMQHPYLSFSRIVLVDTPGFNDTNRSDLEIFQLISGWLKDSYGDGILLNGIIYMHRITDNRMSGASLKNIAMFQKLCGKDAFSRVTFVTTMWDEQATESINTYRQREKQLETQFLKTFIKNGAKLRRLDYEGDKASALTIISDFTADSKRTLLLQKELVDYKKLLQQTQAGQEMYAKLEILIQEQKIQADSQTDEAKKREFQKTIEELQRDLQELKLPLPPSLYNFFYWIWRGVGWETSQVVWSRPKWGY